MGFFDIDIDKTIWEYLPVDDREPVRYEWLKVLAECPKFVYTEFMANRTGNLYNLAHNGQVCYLQAALNDLFDPVADRKSVV